MSYLLHAGDCLTVLPTIPDHSVDLLLTDPPYAEVDRDYGRWTVQQWDELLDAVMLHAQRVVKPTGSCVVVLQPNSERVGKMRLWLWRFLVRTAERWNLVQDAYWWNPAALATTHAHERFGLLRQSVKMCLWFGSEDCYRDQSAVLWEPSDSMKALRHEERATRVTRPSGQSISDNGFVETVNRRGGTSPFNLIPVSNTNSRTSSGARGHGAGTPRQLCDWWVRYLTKPGGLVLDPFAGAGTVGESAVALGRKAVLIEQVPAYCEIIRARLADASDNSE